jgi:hypothetical protein
MKATAVRYQDTSVGNDPEPAAKTLMIGAGFGCSKGVCELTIDGFEFLSFGQVWTGISAKSLREEQRLYYMIT